MNNFTPRAQQALALARKEADRINHNYVGTEHLLLGMLKLGQGIAVNVLQRLGLDLETVRQEVEKQVGPGPETKMAGNIPFTPRVKKVLALASKEAKALNQSYVGTEHILLGLLCEGDGVAARVLTTLEVDIERTRNEVLRELDPNFSHGEAEPLPRALARAPSIEDLPAEPSTGTEFTPRAKEVLVLSRKEAGRLGHGCLGTEHLLLGLLSFGQGVAVHVFQKQGLNLEVVRAEVEKQTGLGPETASSGLIPYTPCAKKALVQAALEARALRHSYVGTEHLLLGLLGDGEGGAACVLKALEIDREQLRADILKELDPHFMWPEKRSDEGSTPIQTRLDYLEEEIGRLRAQLSSGESLPDGTSIPLLQNIHEEIRQIREDFFQKFDTVIRRLDSLAADLTRLRDDVLKGKS